MGVYRTLALCTVISNVAWSFEHRAHGGGAACFALYAGRRGARCSRRSPLSPDQRSRIAELERELASEMPADKPSPADELHFDRNLGSSYGARHLGRDAEILLDELMRDSDHCGDPPTSLGANKRDAIDVAEPKLNETGTRNGPSPQLRVVKERACKRGSRDSGLSKEERHKRTAANHAGRGIGSPEGPFHAASGAVEDALGSVDATARAASGAEPHDRTSVGDLSNSDSIENVLMESVRAAERWESDEHRFRNKVAEVPDNITDKEMLRMAELAEMEENQEGPTMRQLLKKLNEAPASKAPAAHWQGLVQRFDIDADTSHCVGCGIRLQSGSAAHPGFVEPAALSGVLEAKGRPRCQRCSSMRSGLIFRDPAIALGDSATAAARETVAIVRNALALSATRHVTVAYMMDALDIHFERGLADLIVARRGQRRAETHFYVVLNKVDLLPPHSRKRLIMYVHRFVQSRAPALRVKPRHIFLMSARTGDGVNLFLSVLLDEAYRKRSKVFFVGATNTGKSTFINRLSRFVDAEEGGDSGAGATPPKRQLLSTSVIPGTTLRPLRIDAGPGFNLFDTPGIVVPDAFTSHITSSELKIAVPASLGPAKPLRIGAGQSLLLGQFVRIDVLEGRPFFFTPYLSKHVNVVVKRTRNVGDFLAKLPFGDGRVFYATGSPAASSLMPGISWGSEARPGAAKNTSDNEAGVYNLATGSDTQWNPPSADGHPAAPTPEAEPNAEPAASKPPTDVDTCNHHTVNATGTLNAQGEIDTTTNYVRTFSDGGDAVGRGCKETPPTTSFEVSVIGEGWERATADLCIKGLGFVSLAGALELRLRVETLEGVSVYMREPLMAYDGIPFARKRLPTKAPKRRAGS
ncbi:membrane protein, putative [Babesia bigemina]|uniref:Membrane protein, putative n=1 Tax=Babesia bigemina TaxID=5866 RepID=A0A061D522_BABBI|nr:membrane protein, putative [Babesia bigemina]CDR94064.1 membrane protein, putative [Babesia bigemina]|eukprot:XP_012766250.1 membrane protein, putative [Babesia bigemina]